MKLKARHFLIGFSFLCSTSCYLQNNTFPSTGNVGIGTSPALTTPVFNLHLHGTSDYITNNSTSTDNTTAAMGLLNEHGAQTQNNNVLKALVNMGKSVGFGMTNTITGFAPSDGTEFRMTQNDFSILNRENGNFTLGTLYANLTFSNSSSRVWIGFPQNATLTDVKYAKYNVISNDNGIYVRSGSLGKYGLKLETAPAGSAIEVLNTSSPLKQFKVTGNGEVFARRYITSIANIPDYVFSTSYSLMNFSDLRTYISQNQHLPNVPSAADYAKDGVDLGEMNRVLLEKVEELTLYILQLEERMKTLEGTKR